MLSPLRFSVFVAAAIHAPVVQFCEESGLLKDPVHLQEDGVGGHAESFSLVRRAVLGMPHTDDAGTVS